MVIRSSRVYGNLSFKIYYLMKYSIFACCLVIIFLVFSGPLLLVFIFVKEMVFCLVSSYVSFLHSRKLLTSRFNYLVEASIPFLWGTRMAIALGAAKGLAFLHNAERPVIYRDFKTSNILLDSVSDVLKLIMMVQVHIDYSWW